MDIKKAIQVSFEEYRKGNIQHSIDICTEIIRIQPDNVDVLCYLGLLKYKTGAYEEAIHYYKKALNHNSNNAGINVALGIVYHTIGAFEDAIIYFKQAININARILDAYNYLGNSFQELKKFDLALSYYKKAIHIDSMNPTAYINLGILFQNQQRPEEAMKYFNKALQINPNLHQLHDCIGLSFSKQGKLREAINSFQNSLRLAPDSLVALVNLGNLLARQGRLNEAEGLYACAIQLHPNRYEPYGALLMNMLYNSRYDAKDIFSEHRKVAKTFERPSAVFVKPFDTKRSPSRELRIGYVSPDFRRHPVAFFIEPVIAAHHRKYFEVFCYSSAQVEDEVTERIRNTSDHWRHIERVPDEMVDCLIRKDKIDILLDLAGHTAGNRLLVFARKPAPVQITWIGYPATTGFSSIDYKFVDHYTDPSGTTEQYYTERLLRLPNCFICYQPDHESPEVEQVPSLRSGRITFGSCNSFAKITPEVLSLWGSILKSLPESQLILKDQSFSESTTHEYTINMFTKIGIKAERIILEPWETPPKHLSTYNRIDIALDTFPFNGLTTTCEALWMGVPVITLAGAAYASRAGVSLLSNVGLPELIAQTIDEYRDIAVRLANDIKKLVVLRESLRYIMAQSSLTDAKGFTRDLEHCYREIWGNWCRIGV